jgi:hypothetical protein
VLELGKLDLKLSFMTAGAQRENVEDERIAIDNAARQRSFEVSLLARGQFVIEQHDVGFVGICKVKDFLDLAFARVGRRIRCLPLATDAGYRLGASAAREKREFFEPVVVVIRTEIELHDDRALASLRTVNHPRERPEADMQTRINCPRPDHAGYSQDAPARLLKWRACRPSA